MKQFLFVFGLAVNLSGFCQNLTWESGVLITKSQEVLTGSLVYHAAHEAVLIRHKENNKADFFSSHKIQSFRFYDSKADVNRQFICLEKSEFFPDDALLEIVVSGSIKIVRKLKGSIDQLTYADDAEDFNYYIFVHSRLIPLQQFKLKILPIILDRHLIEIKAFIEQGKIDVNTSTAAIRVIKEYNRLMSKSNLVASIN